MSSPTKIFNINSTQQLSDVLFKHMGCPPKGLKKNKSGYYSTAANVLEGLKQHDDSGIINAILEYRELGKLKSTYVDALPEMVNPIGRIHTSFNQTGAVTGRLASSNPNLQNIPIRSDIGQQIRRGFVRPARPQILRLRLLPGGTAHPRPRQPGRSPAQRLPRRPGHTRHHRRRRLRHPAGRSDLQPAPFRQSGQLRPHLRHGRVPPRPRF